MFLSVPIGIATLPSIHAVRALVFSGDYVSAADGPTSTTYRLGAKAVEPFKVNVFVVVWWGAKEHASWLGVCVVRRHAAVTLIKGFSLCAT